MIERYAVVAGRIRQELAEVERIVSRAERAVLVARQRPEDQDLLLDSAALNLHDFYAGLERIFYHIASTVDRSVPSGHEWHRELLRQMAVDVPNIRPQVLATQTTKTIDEFLRFRHIVRNIYTFEFDPDQIEHLVKRVRPSFELVNTELLAFAEFLDQLVHMD